MSDNENEIFELEDNDVEMKDTQQDKVNKKKQKTALSQDRIDKLREQLKMAREAKLKRKEGKETISLKVEEQPLKKEPVKKELVKKEQPIKKEKEPRVPKTPKIDKNELLLKELQALKMEIGSLKSTKQEIPKQESYKPVLTSVSKPIDIPTKPYRLFKMADW